MGGTGMLRGVSLGLCQRGYAVSVIARDRERLLRLREEAAGVQGSLHPLAVDYRSTVHLSATLEQATHERGPIALAVVWIHKEAAEAPLEVARWVKGRYFHLLASSAGGRHDLSRLKMQIEVPDLAYCQVLLGHVLTPAGRRWLTHEEICAGVLEAVDTVRALHVVGRLG